ncbi:MFS transporter [Plantactinospora sp. B6F1]|uniref:MFS transporter n=1 Tax=Plantactinospora sp. B6F1 TaxID=3158971 RepID=UPI0032D8CEFD
MIPPVRPAAPVRWGAGRSVLLLVLSGNMLLDALEVSVASIALPSIGAELGLPVPALQWTIAGFAVGFGGTLLAGAYLAARLGRRRVYLAALLVFAVASLVGGLATDGATLMATRVVKGVCAALTAPAGLAIIASTFPEGPERNRAVSVYGLFGASGFTAGLLLSGVLTTGLGWRWTFLVPAPAALVLFAFALRVVPGSPSAGPGRLAVPKDGRLLRAMVGAAALNGSYWGFHLVATLHMQLLLGWSPLRTGLAFLPASLLLLVSVPYAAALVGRFGTARLIAIGAAAPPIGYALYRPARASPTYLTEVLPTMLLVGAGFALAFFALHVQATAGVPAVGQAMAGGLYQTSVQLGGAAVVLGTGAVLGGGPPAAAVAAHHGPALALVTAVGVAGFLVALPGLLPGRRSAV